MLGKVLVAGADRTGVVRCEALPALYRLVGREGHHPLVPITARFAFVVGWGYDSLRCGIQGQNTPTVDITSADSLVGLSAILLPYGSTPSSRSAFLNRAIRSGPQYCDPWIMALTFSR